jgi:hypothetical protein
MSRCGWFWLVGEHRECFGFVVGFAGYQAVVEAAEHPVEQVPQGGPDRSVRASSSRR